MWAPRFFDSFVVTALTAVISIVLSADTLLAQAKEPPSGPELKKLILRYLEADDAGRVAIRKECDAAYAPLKDGPALATLRKDMLKIAMGHGRKIDWSGTNYFLDEKEKRGKYIARGGKKVLWISLHGGGLGQGEAESAAGSMANGEWSFIFPEVLEKTEHGWTTSGTEEFVMELIDAAKRSGKVDPDRIYLTGHSMGGFGTWTLGAHHADVFAGTAAYAGAPTPNFDPPGSDNVSGHEPGVLPNLFNLRHFFFQSLDDKNVPPFSNVAAAKALAVWKKDHPDGFDYRYVEVEKRGHAAPEEGYLPSQKWVAEKKRNARPKKIVWQPRLPWKKHFYWVYWQNPHIDDTYVFEVKGKNTIELGRLDGIKKPEKFTLLLGAPLIDLSAEVVVKVEGSEVFRGKVARTLSTLLLTLPRYDDALLFDARIDL